MQNILQSLSGAGLSTARELVMAGSEGRRQHPGMDLDRVRGLLERQSGVISRRQLLHAGLTDNDIARLLRTRQLARVHTGVYVDHTGPLLWIQRAWAAVQFHWPAALCGESALVASGVRSAVRASDPAGPIHVAVDAKRRVTRIDGIRVRRISGLAAQVQPSRNPPRLRLEHALLELAARAPDEARAIAVLADDCQERRTTPARLLDALALHPNLRRRAFLVDVLGDVASGTYSLLEHRYLTGVERPHGLPTGKRQRTVRRGRATAYRDVEYLLLSQVVELDGRMGHEQTLDRWDDLDRDIESILSGDTTMRLGWRHVLDRCRTALVVARVLQPRGWTDDPDPCGPSCLIRRARRADGAAAPSSGESSAPGAEDSPQPPETDLPEAV